MKSSVATPIDYATGSSTRNAGPADLLAIGVGTTVCMWVIGYVARMPGLEIPSPVLFFLFLGCLLGGGIYAGYATERGPKGGALAMLITGLLNLLILGSLVGKETPGEMVRAAFVWVPAALLIAAVFGAGGGAIGRVSRDTAPPANWPLRLALVALAATTFLILVGGMVTGLEAGLAVVDWPNTFGYNMFLYPLTRMTGGIYFEHTHRLTGSLVGLTTLILAAWLQRYDARGWLRTLGWVAFVMVCVQGLMGGLRVTGTLTLSQSPADVAPNTTLAIVHGVFAQVFFAVLAVIAATLARTWHTAGAPQPRPSAATDRFVSVLLVLMLLVQLVLGALQRHVGDTQGGMSMLLVFHITMATFVALVAFTAGLRAWMLEDVPIVPTLGGWLLAGTGVQLMLGVAALVAIMVTRDGGAMMVQAVVTTAHQTVGALLLAAAACLALWNHRLFEPTATAPEGVDAVSG